MSPGSTSPSPVLRIRHLNLHSRRFRPIGRSAKARRHDLSQKPNGTQMGSMRWLINVIGQRLDPTAHIPVLPLALRNRQQTEIFDMDFGRILEFINALHREGVEYAVFGAVALGFHGIVRATEDLDLFVRPTPENVASLKRALKSIWDDPAIEEISATDLAGEYPALRYGPPEGRLFIDIVARLGTSFAWEDLELITIDADGQPVIVVSAMTLYQMKRNTVREKDKLDAAALKRNFDLEDE